MLGGADQGPPQAQLGQAASGGGRDLLIAIGHQRNGLVLGPGGNRFSDDPRLGLPLSIMAVLAGVPLIAVFSPLAGHGG